MVIKMSSTISNQWLDEGWHQVRAGVTLIVWSRLALWDEQNLALVAVDENKFESTAGHKEIHNELGRLICWIAFSVGSEYLAKGACLLNGYDLHKNTKVTRPPLLGENIESWIALVIAKDPAANESDLSFGTLGDLPLDKIIKPGQERKLVLAGYKLLASFIRNRDAHRYTRNVRAFHFHAVESVFVPAFNILLKTLDQQRLRVQLKDIGVQ